MTDAEVFSWVIIIALFLVIVVLMLFVNYTVNKTLARITGLEAKINEVQEKINNLDRKLQVIEQQCSHPPQEEAGIQSGIRNIFFNKAVNMLSSGLIAVVKKFILR